MKKLFIPLFVIALFVAGCQAAPAPTPQPPEEETPATTHPSITVVEPASGDTVSSPIKVSGEVRGNWSFEAFFSARVEDMSGNKLGQGPIQLQGDWMTTDFVPFEGEIPFEKGTATEGKLIFEKSNASGEPQFDDSFTVLVKFE